VAWPEWWWPGFLIELAIFITLMLLLTWWLMHWAGRQVDELDAEIKALEAEVKAVERKLSSEEADET
jgi:hypothetical protein